MTDRTRPQIHESWHIITPFKVKNFWAFVRAAEAGHFSKLFKRNQAGFAFCVEPRLGDERPSIAATYELLQAHLSPREYALLRIEQSKEEDLGGREIATTDQHTRYEKVFADRVEPTVYSDDPLRRR